ncbi:MAG: insulinase family protein [Filimonas sp.]|nr:insulinase family protein [Filimonas sp.]
MKKTFLIIASALSIYHVGAQTQIDRSKPPKAGPAPSITIADPVIYKMNNGITVLVVENHKLPKVSATYSIDAGPITEGSKAGVMTLMGQMLNEGTTSKTKAQFDEEVDKMGASVDLNSLGGTASALTRYFDKSFMLMAEALKSPSFQQESFDKLKSQMITGLKSTERNTKAIAGRVTAALVFGKNHPNGEFSTEESVSALKLDDVKNAYAKYITTSRAFLTFVGDITPEQAKALAEKAFGTWKGLALTLPVLQPVKNPATTEVDLVDVPNAVQSEIRVTNLVTLPLSSPDYFAVMLANQILGGGSESYLFMTLREKRGFTYGAYSSISAGRFQTTFTASASVRNEKTDSAIVEFVDQIKRIRTEKVTPEELASAKALYNGSFALGMENPARIATYASNVILNNLPKDFYRTYLQKINAVTIDDIQKAAQKYFNAGNTRIVVTGKAAQVGESLKKLGYPVKEFDKFAKSLEVAPAPKSAGSTVSFSAFTVITNYIAAIGGESELKKITSAVETSSMTVQGMSLSVVEKYLSPNKESMTMSMGPNVLNKEVFDGKEGYSLQRGQKIPSPADELVAKQKKTNIIEQVDYVAANSGYKLESKGIEKVNGADAYKVVVTDPGGKVTTQYYDMNTKLLVKEESAKAMQGGTLNTTIEFADYKSVGKVLMPHKRTLTMEAGGQAQTMELTVSEIKFNTGVTEEDFK